MNLRKYSSVCLVLALAMAVLLFSCKKEYSIETGSSLAVGDWHFKDSAKEFKGLMDTAYIDRTNPTQELHLIGTSNDGTQQFHLILYADSFKVGSYKASAFQSSFDYLTSSSKIYEAGQLNGEFVVKINTINQSLVTGTFSGSAIKNGTEPVQITDGQFKATFAEDIANPTSVGVLGDSLGNCKPVIVKGTYRQGTSLNNTNTIQVQVNVAESGTYYIYTDPVNNVNFTGSGIVGKGSQMITLTGAGDPTFSGEQTYTLHYGNSQCSFTINFEKAAGPSGDYFVTTQKSNWSYLNFSDSMYLSVAKDPLNVNGQSYTVFLLKGYYPALTYSQNDTAFVYRKNGNDYYNIIDYADQLNFDNPVKAETIFLKDNVPVNASWNGPNVTGTVGGTSVTVYVKYTILEKGVPVSLGGFNFPDVIKVKEEFYSGTIPLGITYESWYAKNVGLIHVSGNGISDDIFAFQTF